VKEKVKPVALSNPIRPCMDGEGKCYKAVSAN